MTKVVTACGALALHIDRIARRRGWDVDVRPLPPELTARAEAAAAKLVLPLEIRDTGDGPLEAALEALLQEAEPC